VEKQEKKQRKTKKKNGSAQKYRGKQSRESVESVLKKKRKATVGRICTKRRFYVWNEKVKGGWMMRVVSHTLPGRW